jgi:hypothetical protein
MFRFLIFKIRQEHGTFGGLPLCIFPQTLRISSVRKPHRTIKIVAAACPAQ